MREFKYGVGVIAPNFLLNLLLVKMSQKSSRKPDFWGKNQKDMSDNGKHPVHQWLRQISMKLPYAVLRKSAVKFTKGSKRENSISYYFLLFWFHQNSVSSTKNPAIMLV